MLSVDACIGGTTQVLGWQASITRAVEGLSLFQATGNRRLALRPAESTLVLKYFDLLDEFIRVRVLGEVE
ncbi:MAG: hypothetical protein QGG14_01960, partial [Planctomycetota bacterium]|nr:hypothetical protein [Planctomycetota bacterium]